MLDIMFRDISVIHRALGLMKYHKGVPHLHKGGGSVHRRGVSGIPSKNQDDSIAAADLCGLGSAVAAMCWHREANKATIDESDTVACSALESQYDKLKDGETVQTYNEHPARLGCDPMSKAASNCETPSSFFDAGNSLESASTVQLQRLLNLHNRHKAELEIENRSNHLEIGDKGRGTSLMHMLRLAEKISHRPGPRKPFSDPQSIIREQQYTSKLEALTRADESAKKQRKHNKKKGVERIRILDVDALPLPLLHHMLCYTMTKNVPAELCLKFISRLALYRDNKGANSYQKFFCDVSKMAPGLVSAEFVALATRTLENVGIGFMLDYVRRFGTFSRRFIAELIQKQGNPQALDFLRYQTKGGQRGPNQILTRPWALLGFVKMLKESSAKRYIYKHLMQLGHVPIEGTFDAVHAHGTLDESMAQTILSAERLLEPNQQMDETSASKSGDALARPKNYEKILEAQYMGFDVLQEDYNEEHPRSQSSQWIQVAPHILHAESKPHDSISDEDSTVRNVNIPWAVPWGSRRDVFHFRGKSYARDPQSGWKQIKSNVRIHYSKIASSNRRKRLNKAKRLKAYKLAQMQTTCKL